MNKRFAGVSTGRMKVFLILFCIVSGGLSLYYLASSIFKEEKETTLKIEQVKVPANYNQPGDETIQSDVYVDEETWRKVQSFKMYLDTLKEKSPGQYKDLLLNRPGLLDSIHALEDIYYSQETK